MIAVDTKALASVIGLTEWPEPFHNDHQRMAARCVTDFTAKNEMGLHHPDVAMVNATRWIQRAYDAGLNAGAALERKRWHEKLASMFDIPVGR